MRFVEYGGLGTAPGPLSCQGAVLNGFWLEADLSKLTTLCERVFDEPSGERVRVTPLIGAVMLTFGEIGAIKAGGSWTDRGVVTERQVAVWIPIVVERTDEGGDSITEVGVFIPFMWLDNPISIASGREVYGFPKTLGWATFPGETPRGQADSSGGTVSDCFQLDTFALRRHRPTEQPARTPLLRVRRLPEERRRRKHQRVRGGLPRLATKLARRLPTDGAQQRLGRPPRPAILARWLVGLWALLPAPLRRLLSAATGRWLIWLEPILGHLGGTVKQFFLRQFRAIDSSKEASSSAIVRAASRARGRPRIWLLDEYEIEIFEVDSDPLYCELGIRSGETLAELRVEFDFDIELGTVLWREDRPSG